jgi:hypothetical protein
MATILTTIDTMIATKTRAQAPHRRGLKFSVGTFLARHSRHGTARQRTSQSTLRKRTLDYGSRITSSLARLVVWIVIISLCAFSLCSWPIWREDG